jgi:UDP-3-O-[3-hydroxymyristoyl] N-acetylglucosamine deacetylase
MILSSHTKQKQQTIKNRFSFSGIGLHSGKKAKVTILPSKKNTGITFIRADIDNNNTIKALWSNVTLCLSSHIFKEFLDHSLK